jgi:hypothetical protein
MFGFFSQILFSALESKKWWARSIDFVFGNCFRFQFLSLIIVPTGLNSIFLRTPFWCFHYLYSVLKITVQYNNISFFLSVNLRLSSLSNGTIFSLYLHFSLYFTMLSLSQLSPSRFGGGYGRLAWYRSH